MKANLYDILKNKNRGIGILIDPDKTAEEQQILLLLKKIALLQPSFILIGGSSVATKDFNTCIALIKAHSNIPTLLFPGAANQISDLADGILFLSLISGRNPDFLIGHQVESAHLLKKMDLQIIPTGYLLVDGGKPSSASYMSQTTPIPSDQNTIAVNTVIAGEMLGLKAFFLDAGSGANIPVKPEMIRAIRKQTKLPLIIGGGIKSIEEIELAFDAGANLVVIGNRIEEDMDFILDIHNLLQKKTT